jgi:hypothetical protein
MKKIITLSLFALLFCTVDSYAAKRFWIATATNNWNSTTNWSTTATGAGGSTVPGTNDTAYFTSSRLGGCTINASVNIKRFEVQTGYTGTITQGANTITIGTTGASFNAGTFTGGSAAITCNGAFLVAGNTFTSTSNTLTVAGNFTVSSGNFLPNNGTVTMTATTATLLISRAGGVSFYNFGFAPTTAAATYTITSTTVINVNNNLIYGGTQSIIANTGTINIKKDITINNTAAGGGGSALYTINGTGTQRLIGTTGVNAGRLPRVTIVKTATDSLLLSNFLSFPNTLTYTSGIVNPGSSTCFFLVVFIGNMTLNNVHFAGGNTFNFTAGQTLTANGTITPGSGGLYAVLNILAINVKKDVDMSGIAGTTGGGGSATITFNGAGTQYFKGSTVLGAGRICNIVINKAAADTLKLTDHILALGNWTWTNGQVNPTTSTVTFGASKTISGSHPLFNMRAGGGVTLVIASGTIITCKGTFTITGAAATIINTGTIHAKGNLESLNTATGGGGTATIYVNDTTGTQTITGSGTAGQGAFPNMVIDAPGIPIYLMSGISVAGSWTYNSGSVDPGTSTVFMYLTANLDGQQVGSANTMPFYNLTINTGTTTLTGNLDVDNDLTIGTGTTLSAGANTINVGRNWNSTGTWTFATSTVVMDSPTNATITGASGTVVNFYKLNFNKVDNANVSKRVTLQRLVKVNNSTTLTKGRIVTSATNYIEYAAGSACTGGGIGAYICGPVRKTGNTAFTFPLGDTLLSDSSAFHPIEITAPAVITDQFEALYRAVAHNVGDSLVDSLASVSKQEYWSLNRKLGTSNVTAKISWNKNSNTTNVGSSRVAGWNGTKWLDYGQASLLINWPTGTVGASVAMNFTPNPIIIVIGQSKGKYNGYARLNRKLDGQVYEAKGASVYFSFDDEYNDQNHYLKYKVYNAIHADVAPTLISNSNNAPLSYYGDNRFRLDLYTNSGVLTAGYYILEVTNEKNEKFYLRFRLN